MLRWMRIGALAGAALGTLFALAVVSFADCVGPDCNRERILGVLLHLGIGAPLGAVLGLGAALLHRGWRRAPGDPRPPRRPTRR